MTLPPAPEMPFDKSIPVAVAVTSAITDRHGHVIAGAGEGAAKGALVGGGGSVLAGAYTMNPFGLAAGIVLAPVFMVGGGIAGGVAAHPAAETEAALAAVEAVYADRALLQTLPIAVVRHLDSAGLAAGFACANGALVPEPCIGDDVNGLQVNVVYGFSTEGEYEPNLTFGLDVQALVVVANPTREVLRFRWGYLSPEINFFEATRDGAAQLREELRQAQERLARKIVDDLVLYRTETRVPGQYRGYLREPTFTPDPLPPGVAKRLPFEEDLVDVREEQFSP